MRRRVALATFWVLPLVLPLSAVAEASKGGPVPALYATKAEAENAAKLFHCTGAHPMGDQWMPCARHGEAHGGSH